MLYSQSTGERIILPVNPEDVEIKHEKTYETYDIIDFGQINITGNVLPVTIRLSCLLPEDTSVFALGAGIIYLNGDFVYNNYSQRNTVELFTKWARENHRIRLVIDEELNIEGTMKFYQDVLRESTESRKCVLEILEYRNPELKTKGTFGLLKRSRNNPIPAVWLMKRGDTIYSVANKFGKDYKALALKNNIKNVNENLVGKTIFLSGV